MLPNRYQFQAVESRLAQLWADTNIYAFNPHGDGSLYTIDTPPPTVSGELHLGHCYSYTQTDVIARFHRMRGERVLYPMGFDDNGLPTERFVERTIQRKASEMDRAEFLAQCLKLIQQTEDRFESLWQRLSLSVDWNYRYSTMAPRSQATSQWSFIQLHQLGHVYAQLAPTLWCSDCRTAIAQADLEDKLFPTLFTTFAFHLPDGQNLPIATTRPELLPACVAIFVHPDDARYSHLAGSLAYIESEAFSQQAKIEVPILTDALVDPAKGSGAVMCCTFGDATDVRWWRLHQLPLRAAIGRDGRMTELAGPLAGLSITMARKLILQHLASQDLILHQESIEHMVGIHDRCGTAVEYLQTRQWFIRVLDQKERFIEAGRQMRWTPDYMRNRYEHWVENLQWDWCISRQRFLGVPFPAWTCRSCGTLLLADRDELPVDPRLTDPHRACICGSTDFEPEPDVMDTWATSSCSPLIISRWIDDATWFQQHYPLSLRPQAHDIIRTWAFYTIVKALYHCDTAPWQELMISGHALSSDRSKISKSAANNSTDPLTLIDQWSADVLRYWATSIKPGQDTSFSSESLSVGRRLVTKLWNASRFAESRLHDLDPTSLTTLPIILLPTDRWLLARLARTIVFATKELACGEFSAARNAVEHFFWSDLCDNYLELVKSRLYNNAGSGCAAAQWTLYHALLNTLKLFAPYLPYVTEEIYLGLFRQWNEAPSIHCAPWPIAPDNWLDADSEEAGTLLLEILSYVRRKKAEFGISVGAELKSLQITVAQTHLPMVQAASCDIQSATRARTLIFTTHNDQDDDRTQRWSADIILP
jgi:valyl-tRNA synthetase